MRWCPGSPPNGLQSQGQRRKRSTPPAADSAEAFAALHLLPSAPVELIGAPQRVLARQCHPDAGGDPARGAQLLGATDALTQATGATLGAAQRVAADRIVAWLRERLAQEDLAVAYREGRALSFKAVAALALMLYGPSRHTMRRPLDLEGLLIASTMRRYQQLFLYWSTVTKPCAAASVWLKHAPEASL